MRVASRAATRAAPIVAPRAARLTPLCLFLATFALECALSYALAYRRGIVISDGISRTANAWYVFALEPHKLASIGFVWNPLPSLVQLPIVWLAKLWKPLASHGLAGGVMTALFSAATAAYLYRAFVRRGTGAGTALLFTALYALNPFNLFYGANGMSEAPFFLTVLVVVDRLLAWHETRDTLDLVWIAAMLALGFLCRYETADIALNVGLCLVAIVFAGRDAASPMGPQPFRRRFSYLVATCAVVFLPVLYAVGVWILLNATIMGDPLHFLRSAYANASQSALMTTQELLAVVGRPLAALGYSMVRLLPFLPPLLALLFERLATRRARRLDLAMLGIMVASIVAFQYALIVTQSSFGWFRFFAIVMPMGAGFLPHELPRIPGPMRRAALVCIAVAYAVSGAQVVGAFSSRAIAQEEYEAFALRETSSFAGQRRVAEAINERYPEDRLLLDSFTSSALVVNLDHPENLYANQSPDFAEAIERPWDYGVRYVLVPEPVLMAQLDAINIAHPDLYERGAAWCALRDDYGAYRLYEVVY